MLSRRLGCFSYCITDLFFLAEQVNLFHKFLSGSDLYMKTNLNYNKLVTRKKYRKDATDNLIENQKLSITLNNVYRL